jgi:hypothetical protein
MCRSVVFRCLSPAMIADRGEAEHPSPKMILKTALTTDGQALHASHSPIPPLYQAITSAAAWAMVWSKVPNRAPCFAAKSARYISVTSSEFPG